MPEFPPFIWVAIILGMLVMTGVDKVKFWKHYHEKPQLGCHMTYDGALCYHDERDYYFMIDY